MELRDPPQRDGQVARYLLLGKRPAGSPVVQPRTALFTMSYQKLNSDSTARQTADIDIIRDPEDIAPSEHFLRRFSSRHGASCETRSEPEITGAVIETCIRDGDVRPGDGDSLLYEAHVDGYDWRLVVGFEHGAPTVVTAYVPGVHTKRGGA